MPNSCTVIPIMTAGGTKQKVSLSEPGAVQSGGPDPKEVILTTLWKQHDPSVLIIKQEFFESYLKESAQTEVTLKAFLLNKHPNRK